MTGEEQVQLALSRCFSTKTEPAPVLTLPPLVVPVYHASVSGALPRTVVLYSSAMVRPVPSAPWKKTSLIWIAPISASQTSQSSPCSQPPPLQAVEAVGKGTGFGPMLLEELQGGRCRGECAGSRGLHSSHPRDQGPQSVSCV